MDNETALFEDLQHPLLALRFLAGPILQNLVRRPAGDRPDELLRRWQIPVLVHDLQRLVNHRGAVTLDDVAGHVGVADVKVGFEHDDDLPQGRRVGGGLAQRLFRGLYTFLQLHR